MRFSISRLSTNKLYERSFPESLPGKLDGAKIMQESFNELARRITDCAKSPTNGYLSYDLSLLSPDRARLLIAKRFEEIIDLGNRLSPEKINNFIHLLGAAVAIHDSATEKHQARVTSLSVLLGHIISKSVKVKIRELEVACHLHDFGKLGISRHLLEKPQPSEEEIQILRTHVSLSYYFTHAIDPLRSAAEIIRFNHAYDGYPSGCKVQDMPIESQILSAADCYDALTNSRPYRTGNFSSAEAMAKIRERKYPDQVQAALEFYVERYAATRPDRLAPPR